MAVYPDRIVLKNSTDAQVTIESLIGSGGTDEILPGEIVIGRESGSAKAYVLDADGNIVAIGGGGGSIVASIDDLTDADTSTDPPQGGEVLGWDGTNWRPFISFGTYLDISGFTEQVGTTTDYPLAGSSTHYADLAAMQADGWTYIVNTTYENGSARSFDPGVNWDGIDFLGNGITSGGQWFINTSGGVGWDNSNNTTNLTSNDISVLSNGIDFYVSLWNEGANNGTVRAGWKEHVAEGRTWLVVRLDSYYGASITGGGYVTETWFGQDGSVSVRIGPKFGTNNLDIGVFTGRNTIGSNGSVVTGVANPFTGMDQGSNLSSGDYVYNLFGNPFPRNDFLGNLGDVNLSNLAAGNVLEWDGTQWSNAVGGGGGGGLSNVVEDPTPQLGGELDVNGNAIVTATGSNANVIIDPDGTGVLQVLGNTDNAGENDGAIQLNCSANTHGVKIKSPPHSAAASYTLVLPTDTGSNGEVLTTDGAGVLSWSPAGSSTLLGLNDVWAPTAPVATWTFSAVADHASAMQSAEAYSTTDAVAIHPTAIEGDQKASLRAWIATLPPVPTSLTVKIGGTETTYTLTAIVDEMDAASAAYQPRLRLSLTGITSDGYIGDLFSINEYDAYMGAVQEASDGDVIQWVAANNRWEATALAGGGGASVLNDLTDVTITAAAAGEVLRYNGSAWVDAQLAYTDLSGTPTNVSSFTNDAGYLVDITAEPIGDLSNVVLTSATTGDVLSYNGTNWVNTAAPPADISGSSINGLSDVDTATSPPSNGEGLIWNSTSGNWEPGTVNAGSVALDDLTDVTITAAATGEVLRYNGSAWVDAQLAYSDLSGTPSLAPVATSGDYNDLINKPSIPVNVDDLGDVTITSPANGQILEYNGSAWVNVANSGGGGATAIDDLTDVDTATNPPTPGQVLKWDGTNWVPGTDISGGGGSATLGRGDGGDLDTLAVDSAFVFGVYGGGDIDTTAQDDPIEFVTYDVDGGEIT